MSWTGHSLHPASTPASRPTPVASLPGTWASPRTGLSPAAARELSVSSSPENSSSLNAPELLDARQRSDPETTSGTGFRAWPTATPPRSAILIVYLALAKQVTCSPILLPLFHGPVNECSPSDGALRRESSGLAVLPSRSAR